MEKVIWDVKVRSLVIFFPERKSLRAAEVGNLKTIINL